MDDGTLDAGDGEGRDHAGEQPDRQAPQHVHG
jgi:hypothetical protein